MTAWSSCCRADSAWARRPGCSAAVGGATRSDSVRAGLALVPDDADVVVVHDAARPLASRRLFDLVVQAVADGADGAVPALPVADTVKRVDGDRVVETRPRDGLVGVQTPQAFRADVLRAVASARRRRHRRRRAGRGRRRSRGRGGGRAAQPEADPRRRPRARAGAARRGPRVKARDEKSGRARLRRASVRRRVRRSCSAACTSPMRRGSRATPTATRSRTRSPTRCSARPGCPISARCSRLPTSSLRDADSLALLGEVVSKVAARRLVDRQRRHRDRGRDAAPRSVHGGRWPRTLTAVLAPRQGADGPRHPRVGAPEAGRGARRDRAGRGHRGVGGRVALARLGRRKVPTGRVGRLGSLAACSGSTTPPRAPRSTSCRASAGHVSMYVCGPTPYDAPHLGHGRKEVVFDTIRRYLLWRGFAGHVRQQRHRRRRQHHRPGRTRGHDRAGARVASTRHEFCAPVRSAQHPAPRRDAAGDRVDRRDAGDHRRARRVRARVRDRGRGRLLPGRLAARIRRAVAPHARRAARERGRARRGRRAQAQPGRLRAVEGGEAGRAELGLAVGTRPSGLAHRVLGDVARRFSATASTSTVAATTSCSRTTRTSSRRRSAPATSSRATGSTTRC